MKLLYKEARDGVCIQRCYGLDGEIELPDRWEGRAVTELDRYLFSHTVRGRQAPPSEYEGDPELCGDRVTRLALPEHLRRVGPYAFYNCSSLRSLSFYSSVRDWGAGVFTGCSGIQSLAVREAEQGRSCFMEVLQELPQTLTVDYRDWEGRLRAKLIFPEFFEESVENTPGRIIMREMHGCGHMYRCCFEQTRFQFHKYDHLFPYVEVQEKPELVSRLALYRLRWPSGLSEEAEKTYWSYLSEHGGDSAAGMIGRGERGLLAWAADAEGLSRKGLEDMLEAASALGDAQSCAVLLDAKHRRFGAFKERRTGRTFEL